MTAKAARSTLKCDNGAMSSAARLEQTPLPPLSVPEKKLELRGQIRATRKQRSANQQQKMAEALAGILEGVPELQAAQCVAAYVRSEERRVGKGCSDGWGGDERREKEGE